MKNSKSLKHKLTTGIILVYLAFTVVLSGVYLWIIQTQKNNILNTTHQEIDLLAQDFVKVLTKGDIDDVADTISRIHTHQNICNVYLYDNDHNIQIAYSVDEKSRLDPTHINKADHVFGDDYLSVYAPVLYQDHTYGTVYLRTTYGFLQQNLRIIKILFASILLIVTLTAFFTYYFLRKSITDRLSILSGALGDISQHGDYNLHLTPEEHDEIGDLYTGFNLMMQQIRKTNQKLENLISDRTRVLDERELQYKTLFELSEDATMTLDEKGLADCNQATLRIFGYKRKSDILGKFPHELSPPLQSNGKDSLSEANRQVEIAKQKGKNLFEWLHQRSNGEVFPAEVLLTPVDLGGHHVVQGIVRDITSRKQSEQQIIRAKEEAEQANQAKSLFLSSMSHELRTPMNAILGFSQLLEIDASLTESQKDYVNEILKASHHLLILINEILDLSKIESDIFELTLQPVNLSRTISESIMLTNNMMARRNITIHTNTDSETYVKADATRLKQALLNLLSNAIKYNKTGGSVTIDVHLLDDALVRIDITDTGAGIPPERMHELFQPFNRLEAEGSSIEGTGIGLALTSSIVQAMHGHIDVQSEPGVGSTFSITLSVAEKP